MNDSDFKIFSDAVINAYEFNPGGKAPGGKAISAGFRLLKPYPLTDVIRAIEYHQATEKFGPSVAEIVAILERGRPKHPEPNEAWAIVLKSFDEAQTVFMTQIMKDARLVAYEVWIRGDKIGARMAFLDTYKSLLRAHGKTLPDWGISVGYDPALRESGVLEAVRLGRITQQYAQKLLPSSQDGGEVGKLLTGKVSGDPVRKGSSQWNQQKLREFKDAMAAKILEIDEKEKQELLDRIHAQDKAREENRIRLQKMAAKGVDGEWLTNEVKEGLCKMHKNFLESEK